MSFFISRLRCRDDSKSAFSIERVDKMLEEIKRLIALNYSERGIAEELDTTRDIIRGVMRKHQLKTNSLVCKPNEERFRTLFNKQYDGLFIYVSGYTHNNSCITIRCLKCGEHKQRHASILRKVETIRCLNCYEVIKQELIADKEREVALKRDAIQAKKDLQIKNELERFRDVECAYCENHFLSKKQRAKFCSRECLKKFSNKERDNVRREQLKKNGKYEWSITIPKLIKRDKVCKLCGRAVDITDIVDAKGTKIAGDNYPSIDHIIPVSKGGTHTWDNVQLAHRGCNTNKNNKTNVIAKVGRKQLALNL